MDINPLLIAYTNGVRCFLCISIGNSLVTPEFHRISQISPILLPKPAKPESLANPRLVLCGGAIEFLRDEGAAERHPSYDRYFVRKLNVQLNRAIVASATGRPQPLS